MPFSAALWMTQSACAKYFSLGVEKSPGVVKGASPALFSGGCLTKLVLNQFHEDGIKPFLAPVLQILLLFRIA